MDLATLVALGFAALCVMVFAAAAAVLMRATATARRLKERAELLAPIDLFPRLERFPEDVARLQRASDALKPLLLRGLLAVASIASTLRAARGQFDAARAAFHL